MTSDEDTLRKQRYLTRQAARQQTSQQVERKSLFSAGRAKFVLIALLGIGLLVTVALVISQRNPRGNKEAGKSLLRSKHESGARSLKQVRRQMDDGRSRGLLPWSGSKPHISGAKVKQLAVPILMYHVISTPKPGTPLSELWVSKQRFAEQVNILVKQGYVGVTLEQVLYSWKTGSPLPAKPVVVSFDDGYLSHVTNALPILRNIGWPGVLNLEIKNIGSQGIPANGVKKLIVAGWEIDSHTVTHPDLTTISAAALRRELVQSRREIQQRFRQPANLLCYPAGKYNETVIRVAKAAGYYAATTVEPGYGAPTISERFRLKRIRVNGDDSAQAVFSRVREMSN